MQPDEQERPVAGPPGPTGGSLSDAAAASAQGQWELARAGFEAVLAKQESAEALEGLAEAAWWLEDASAVLTELAVANGWFQRAHRLLDELGPVAEQA